MHPVEQDQQPEYGSRRDQQRKIDLGRIEQRDHQNRPEVVDDRQGRQEDFQRQRHPVAQQRQHTDGKCDIGGHRNTPPRRIVVTVIEDQVNGCRKQHSADGRRDGHRRLAGTRQFAGDNFTLDLQSDIEKEDHHQPVVDPMLDALRQGESVEADREMTLQDAVVPPFGRGQVAQHEGQHHEYHQHHAARPRAVHKPIVAFREVENFTPRGKTYVMGHIFTISISRI